MRIWLVDAFASERFTGNVAAVCPLEGPPDERWMQQVALEMNQPETALCWPEGGSWRLRWFTPTTEVDLCGHATLATAHVLWEQGLATGDQIEFETRSGTLVCSRRGDQIALDFPALDAVLVERQEEVASAIGAPVLDTYMSKFDLLALVADEETVRSLGPDLAKVEALGVRGLIVAAQGREYDCISRFFGPSTGIPEDPVTGSAHCVLGPFFGQLLDKSEIRAFQASARGGEVTVELHGDRVHLIGCAITTLAGELL